jgi:hypothetical protein
MVGTAEMVAMGFHEQSPLVPTVTWERECECIGQQAAPNLKIRVIKQPFLA